ncbi:External alternative NAD(P)H-ubiquinone oxidoreductase B3, mitochondrial [Lecanosticta acicola]|uniref:External alternative NAD(P)H-ubiquinone oxidoreductase B3, mitochondrial n=1 Tax=Lecanosticta acicola TaxID=111012 RepID=A0AAI9EAU3_9PEZI|nr:External alternative NAD(P)H-ubiquinone oxidoreductase B3, mitochondrial [Lecanosticta acicola]
MQCLRRTARLPVLSHCLLPTAKTSIAATQTRHASISHLDSTRNGRERVVVLGSGWGGFTVSRDLDPNKYQVVVVSPRSYFIFTPLLAGTSVGTLEFRTILEPIRRFRKRGLETEFFQGWADRVDLEKRTLTIEEATEDPVSSRALTYGPNEDKSLQQKKGEERAGAKKGELFDIEWDKLIVAVGCYAQTFNTPGVRQNAYFLKDAGDARRIRNRLLSCFEIAALPTTDENMKRHFLNFAVVGGGPTGIEWSAELYDLIYEDMRRLYPALIKYVNITVYDVAPNVLSMFDESLGKYAMKHFSRQGIAIKTSHHIQELRPGVPQGMQPPLGVKDGSSLYTLKLQEEGEIAVGMCVWSTGLAINPFVERALKGCVKQHEKSHAIMTDARLQAKDTNDNPIPSVYAIGDCAILEGTAYPATAQVANQKARWLAKHLNKGDIDRTEFTYRDLGVMAYLGGRKAVLQSGKSDISGWIAWVIWRGAYLTKTVSWRNRILIPIYWSINWLFGRDISRF